MTLESRLDQWSQGWRGPLLAAVIALLAGLPGVFAIPPLDRDESRFAQATAQMLESGDFVAINYQDQPRDKKPVGIHWLQSLSVATFSQVENRDIWPYRLPSLLGAMLAAAACAWGAAAFMGPRLGLFAGSMLGASFLLSTEAFIAKTDAVLAGCTTLAMAALARMYLNSREEGVRIGWRTKLLFWLGLSMAILVKGPVAPMVVTLTLIALALWDRRVRWMTKIGWGWGVVLLLAIVGPWALAITVTTDGAFWGAAITGDLTPKLTGGHERHGGLFGYHTLISPFLTFPGALLLPAGLVLGWKARAEPGVRFALCWLIPTWLVFELLPTKLVHYTLPAHGALYWLMAYALREPLGRWVRISGSAVMGVASLGYAGICIWAYSQYGGGAGPVWVVITAALFVISGAVGAFLLLRKQAGVAVIAAGAAGILAHGAMAGQLAPRLNDLWLSERIQSAMTRTGLDPKLGIVPGPVEVAGYAEPSLVFALGTNTGLQGAQEAVDALVDGRPAVVEKREEPAFLAAMKKAGLTPKPAGVISGLDYTNGDAMTLTLYRGEPQPETDPQATPDDSAPPATTEEPSR